MKTRTKVLSLVAIVLVIAGAILFTNTSLLQGSFHSATTGGVTIAVSASTPREDIVIAGDSDVEVSEYTLTATKEDFIITDLTINNKNDTGAADNNISSIALTYEDSEGSAVEETSYLVSGVATFNGLELYVPKDDTAIFGISVTLNSVFSSGTSATSGELIHLYMGQGNFTAVGQTSGKTVSKFSGTSLQSTNKMHVHEGKATLSLSSASPSGSRSVSASDDLFVFNIAADSSEKVQVQKVVIDLASDADFDTSASVTAYLIDAAGITIDSSPVIFSSSSAAEVTFDTSTSSGREIAKKTNKDWTLRLSTTDLLNEDSIESDPLAVSIDLGSSSRGTVTPGGFWWSDTNTIAKWLGNVAGTKLIGNALFY